MKLTLSRLALASLAISAAALISACGSGGGTDAVAQFIPLSPGTDVPLTATQTSVQAIDFVRMVVSKGEADADTALVVGDVVLATSETDDPEPV